MTLLRSHSHRLSALTFVWCLLLGLLSAPVFAQGDESTAQGDDTTGSEEPVASEEPALAEEPAEEEAVVEEPAAEPEPESSMIVRAIEFKGNRRIQDEDILTVMRLRPGMPFSPGTLQEDMRRINEMGVWAAPPEYSPEAVGTGVRLVILLEENPPFLRAQVVVDKGPGLYPTGDLERAFTNNPDKPFVVGEVISNESLSAGIKGLESVYRDNGYAAAGVTLPEVITEGAEAGTIILHVNEGIIHEIRLAGVRKTNEEVIWREITFEKGDVFSARELGRIRNKLMALQLFDDVAFKPDFTDDQELIVILEFVESRTGQLGFGVGYSSNDGLLGTLSYAERNFQGKGQSIRASGQFGGPEPEGSLSYFIPYFQKNGASLGLELFRQSFTDTERDPDDRDRFASYDTRRTGGEIRYVFPVMQDVDASVGLKFLTGDISLNPESTADLTDVSEFARRGRIDGSSNSITLGVTRDTRDFPLDPAAGSVSSLTANYFGGPLGGDFDAVKITGEFKRYWRMSADESFKETSGPIERPHVLAFRLAVGGTIGDLGGLDRYELGGTSSIRGVDFATQTGDKEVLANLEYRFPVITNLTAAVFMDAGTAAQPGQSLNFDDILATIGVGVRYRIPFLGAAPLRLDWGFDLTGEDSQVVIGFGQMF